MDLCVPFKFREMTGVALPLEVKSETILLLLTCRTTIGVFEDEVVGVGVAAVASTTLVGGVMGLGLDAAAPPPAWGDKRTRDTEPGPQGITPPRVLNGETTCAGLLRTGVRPPELV